MYGFQPKTKAPQESNDGGLVARMKSADAGPATFGSRGLSQLRDLIPKMQAMGYPQAPTASDPRAAQLQAMIPQMEAMGFKQQPQYFANGGMVRGAGTGTSDSITARLSHGEYVLPADTVRAVGVGTLDAMREATHKPVKGEQSKAARGFFAGGTPGGAGAWFQDQQREQEQRKQEALAAGQAADSAAQAGAYAPGVTQRSPGASELYMQDRANEMKDQWGQGKYAQAAGTAARTAVQGLGMYGLEAADKLSTPVIDAARDFGRGLLGSDTNTAKPATQPEAPAQNPTDMRLAAGTQTSPMSGAMNQPKPQPDAQGDTAATTAREVVPGVYNHGRGQYSDDPNGMNMPKGFTGQPSAANNAILQRMSDQSQAESMARVGLSQYAAEVQRAKNINADEAARNNSVGARMQRLADPFTAEGRAMRNLQMNIDSSVDRNGRPTAETAALVAQSKAMSDGYLAEPGQERSIMGALQREGMQQAGANARAMLSSGIDQQRVNLASNEFGLKRETQGIANRSANMIQTMQQQIAAEQDPAKRQGLVQRMRELQGQSNAQQPYEFKVSPNIKNADGSMTEGGAWVFNPNSGKAERVDGVPGQQQGQGGAGKFEVGQVYRDSQTGAQRRWNGQAWEKV